MLSAMRLPAMSVCVSTMRTIMVVACLTGVSSLPARMLLPSCAFTPILAKHVKSEVAPRSSATRHVIMKQATHIPRSRHKPALGVRGGGIASRNLEPRDGISSRLTSFFNKRFFLIGAAAAVSLARLSPAVGATGGILRPELTVSKAGVSLIFFLVGLTIKVGELAGAALNMRLNLLTQAFSLGVLPAVGVGLARTLAAGGLHPALADGVLILMALPTTVNMCVILTQSAEGNTAAAAFNAVLGNLLGVVVTPVLLLLMLGRRVDATPSLVATFRSLGVKVVLPLVVGQLARFTPVHRLQKRKPKVVSRLSECILLSIIYTTFCDTFISRAGIPTGSSRSGGGGGGGVFLLMMLLPAVHLLSIASLDALSRLPVMKLSERDRTAVMFCGSHKTLAFGMPLIKALFEGHPHLGMLATPLLLFHPSELILGSVLAPILRARTNARDAADAEVADKSVAKKRALG